MAAEMATSIATTVFDHSLGAIVRQFGYLWNHKKNMAALKAQVKKFDDVREDNNHSVLVAKRNADRIKSRVESWQNNAEEISAEAIKVIEEYEDNAKAKCLIGLCPNVVSRYQLSRKACKKQIEIVEALKEAEQIGGVSERAVRRAISIPSTEGYVAFDSRMSTLEKIVNALQDVTKNMVGVYGFGGMGKTTLVKQVASRVAEKGIFDEIIMALVTQTPDFKEIQGQIAKKIDLKLEESSVAERAGRIYRRLKEKKVLVILDDLWDVLDLEKVGIPFGAEHMGCKILLTSRYQGILSSMGSKSIFHLGALEEKEAWSLFEEKTGDVIKDLAFLNIGKEVAKRCAGLPVLIVTVGASLSSRPNLLAWKEVLNQLKKMKNKEMHEFVNSAMEFISYKHLGEPHKRLFLLCGLLGNGASIANLLKYSLGWRLFDEAGRVEDARSKLHVLILDLKASCLLLDGDDEDIIKIHDGVRGVSISIARKDLNMHLVGDNDTELKRWPQDDVLERCTALVFHASSILPCLPECLECPSLEFLHISSNVSLTVPDPFFESTRLLEVLDMSGMSFQTLPPSISFLGNLQTLCLDSCNRLKDISILGELKNLQVLSLAGSYNIEELPEKIGQLSELRLLDLSRCSALKVIPAGLLKGLSQLEELYMSGSFNGWEAKRYLRGSLTSNVSLAELKHLPNLCSLEIEVPNTQLLSRDLDFENLERFTIIVGDKPVWKIGKEFDMRGISRKISLQLDTTSIIHLQHNVKRLLKRAESLCLKKLKGIKSVIHELDNDGFPELKRLIIDEDDEIQFIVNVETKQHKAFPALESLYLCSLLKLKKICNGRLMEPSFCKLTIVKVRNCDRLESLFSFSMAFCLPCLQEIKVYNCGLLKGIVAKKSEEDDNVNANYAVYEEIEFLGLRKLSLKCLPQLINFYSVVKMLPMLRERQQLLKTVVQCEEIFPEKEEPNSFMPFFKEVSFPRMEELTFSEISNLKCIWSQYHPEILGLKNLQKLSVEKCGNLKYLFTPASVVCLVGLRELSIRSCKMMKEIVMKEEGDTTTNAIQFPQLSKLYLQDLPNLTTFYSGVEQIGSNENNDTVTQPLFNEKAKFPSLKSLIIDNLDNIKGIWHNQLNKEDPFCKLEDVVVRNCANLLKIFPSTMLNKIHSVKKVWILDCEALEEVFQVQQGLNLKEITNDITTVSQLRDLYLDGLPKLRFVWKKDFHKILSFENLCEVDVRKCESLKCVFPAYVAQCLHQLKELHIEECEGLETIVEDDDDGNKEVVEVSPTFTFPKLTDLFIEKLPKVECFYPRKHALEWPLLKVLNVKDCNKIYVGCMLNLSGHDRQNQFEKVSFSNLEELNLSEISNLICLWNKYHPSILSLRNLQKLSVEKCDSLKYLFTRSIIVSFEQLQELKIQSCVMLKEIVAKDEEETTMDAITFPQLSYLYLEDLPNLVTFYPGVEEMCPDGNICTAIQPLFSGKANLPNLKKLEINNLDKIKSMWHNQPNKDVRASHLCEVDVRRCKGLKYVFPAFVARSLSQLEELHVADCKGMKTIVDVDDEDENKEVLEKEVSTTFIFPKLARLYLSKLPKVECFYPKKHTMEWPLLKTLDVHDCGKVSGLDLLNFAEHQEHNQFEMVLSKLEVLAIRGKDMKMMTRQYSEVFLNLRRLTLSEFEDGDESSTVFPSKFLHGLHNVESLYIQNSSFEEIFPYEGEELSLQLLLPHLTRLILENLPELKYICREDSPFILILDKVKRLEINGCPGLTNVVPTASLSFKLLTYLTVTDCGGLINLIPSTAAAACLENLHLLEIIRCEKIEEIVAADHHSLSLSHSQPQQDHEILITFSKLMLLHLRHLPRLTSFCTANNYTFNFPILDYVSVGECPNMRTFSPGITITPMLQRVYTGRAENHWKGDLSSTIQHMFSESREAQRLTTTDPSTSSNNHVEPEAQSHEKLTETDICEEVVEEGKVAHSCDKGKGKQLEICEEKVLESAGNEGQISNMSFSQHGESSLSGPSRSLANEIEEQTNAESLAPQDVASSSQLSPTSDHLETSPSLVTEAGTSRAGSNSQQNDYHISRDTQEFITLPSEEQETTSLDTIDPSTSSNNRSEPAVAKQIESAGKEVEEISEDLTELGNEAEICEDFMKPEKEFDISEKVIEPRDGIEIPDKCNEPNSLSLESNISKKSHPHSQTHVSSFFRSTIPFYEDGESSLPEEESSAGSFAPQDIVASSSLLSPTSNRPETSLILVTEPRTSRRASSSDSHQILRATKEYITLLSKFLQVRQTQPLNTMSTEQIQFVVDAFRDLSNFSIELHSPYVEKARERLSIVERKKKISELELKIAETKAQLEALEENKKALEEENEAIASRMNLDD